MLIAMERAEEGGACSERSQDPKEESRRGRHQLRRKRGTPQYRSPGFERIAKKAPRTLPLSAKSASLDAWRAILLYGR